MSNSEEYKNHREEPEIDELTKDRYLGGHEYDGIRELDNKLPRWWVYLFYATIIFAIVYMLGYHGTKWWPLQDQEYKNEMAVQDGIKKANPEPVIDLEAMVPMKTAADLAAGPAEPLVRWWYRHSFRGNQRFLYRYQRGFRRPSGPS